MTETITDIKNAFIKAFADALDIAIDKIIERNDEDHVYNGHGEDE